MSSNLPPKNPAGIRGLTDLAKPGLRFANRQPGSGTRVWLDEQLHEAGINPGHVLGYQNVYLTHSDVARVVAENAADIGLCFEGAARPFGLDFIPLTSERYDLIVPADKMDNSGIQSLVSWLSSSSGRKAISDLPGYDTRETGHVQWLD